MHEPSDFDAIRPYRDDEAAAVVARLCRDPDLRRAAAVFFMPRFARLLPELAQELVGRYVAVKTRHIHTVRDVQRWLTRHMARIISDSTDALEVTGLDRLQRGVPYLFISNHRDIVMDSALLNFALHQAGLETTRTAVGDNLFTLPCAADLMRLNKSFVVQRRVSGAKALLKAVSLTSAYIRHSLEEGVSVWIAQREGRAKDGYDSTDAAVLKMLALAWRNGESGVRAFVENVRIVPVSVSYELDACDTRKAHELCVAAETGRYIKAPDEDLRSMVQGIVGYKGRVHLAFGAPFTGPECSALGRCSDFVDADALASALDAEIARGLRLYPTHIDAAARVGAEIPAAARAQAGGVPAPNPRVTAAWQNRLAQCPGDERPYLIASYANIVRNVNDHLVEALA